jgi:hypothetical protein
MIDDKICLPLAIIICVPLIGLSLVNREKVASNFGEMLRAWAEKENLQVLYYERREVFRGPFWTRKGALIYRIRVKKPDGKEREGWIALGSRHIKDIEVKWDAT